MIVENGRFNGQQLVPADWIASTYLGTNKVRDAWGTLEIQEAEIFGESAFYHNQYRVIDSEKGIMIAFGAMGQLVYTNASDKIVAVFQSNSPIQNTHAIGEYQLDLMDQIENHLQKRHPHKTN